jgi:myo-inositol-1(or 4)-monophosphatase
MARALNVRRLGAAALDLCCVASGRYDAYWERGLQPWDIAAGLLIVREAGGYVTDADGGQDMLDKGSACVGNERIHRPVDGVPQGRPDWRPTAKRLDFRHTRERI